MDFVYAFNHTNGTRLAYTFDAGPNCCLLLEQETLPLFKAAFVRCFQFHCEFLAELDGLFLDFFKRDSN
jgi:mevalonate pyrophosphate decarboxylase